MVRWGESGRALAIGLCGLSAIKVPLNGRLFRPGRSLGAHRPQSTALCTRPLSLWNAACGKFSRARRGMRESLISGSAWNLPARPVRGVATCALAVAVLSLMLLSVAIWNRFPLIFYDTGGYVLEGLGHVF